MSLPNVRVTARPRRVAALFAILACLSFIQGGAPAHSAASLSVEWNTFLGNRDGIDAGNESAVRASVSRETDLTGVIFLLAGLLVLGAGGASIGRRRAQAR